MAGRRGRAGASCRLRRRRWRITDSGAHTAPASVGAAQSYLEIIRFAASNRMCVELDCQGSTRRIEPYSLRCTRDGNIILHAHNVDRDEHRSYRVNRMQGARVINRTFVPRFAIELTPKSIMPISPMTTRAPEVRASTFGLGGPTPVHRLRTPHTRRSTRFSSDPTYVYECSYCGKRFNRKARTSALNPHKDQHGYPCHGRYAHWVGTQ